MKHYASSFDRPTYGETAREVFGVRVRQLIELMAPYSPATSYGQRENDALRSIARALSAGKHNKIKAINAKLIDPSRSDAVAPSHTDMVGVAMLRILHELGVSITELEYDNCGFIKELALYNPAAPRVNPKKAQALINQARKRAGNQVDEVTDTSPAVVFPAVLETLMDERWIDMQSASWLMGVGINSARGQLTRKLNATRVPTYADAGVFQLLAIALTAGLNARKMLFNKQGDLLECEVIGIPQVNEALRVPLVDDGGAGDKAAGDN